MNRLTTDHPKNILETAMNMVYIKNRWQYIRYGETEMQITDFCLRLCKERMCVKLKQHMSDMEKDALFCDCMFYGCQVATIYAALSGFGYVRYRLKRYEDAGITPPKMDGEGDAKCQN